MGIAAKFLHVPSLRKQSLLGEYATLQHAQLDGVFVSITPGDPSLWVGIIFVRKGPYAPAILRFQISFPPAYPDIPPLVTFSTDVFHPLIAPLTTHSYTPSPVDTNPTGVSEDGRLAPGVFSLRHGFPAWFNRLNRDVPGSLSFSTSTENSTVSPMTPTQDIASASHVSVIQILRYITESFSNETLLDSIPQETAANIGAFHAWRTFRGNQDPVTTRSDLSENQLTGRSRRPGEWNWDGVWEARIQKGVNASLSESVLYGTSAGEDIRFLSIDEESMENIRNELLSYISDKNMS